jgi:hemoglobin
VFSSAVLDWPGHVGKLQAFWSSVMLTSGRYKGQPLPAHIKHADQISPQSFDRWLMIWGATTADLMDDPSAAALQTKAAKIAESLSLGVEFSRAGRTRLPVARQTPT